MVSTNTTPEVYVNKWLELLESDEFDQGKHALAVVDISHYRGTVKKECSFCVMGFAQLAVDIVDLGKENVIKDGMLDYKFIHNYVLGGKVRTDVAMKLNLVSKKGGKPSIPSLNLIDLNDYQNVTKKEFAELIRSQPKGLFKRKLKL